MTNHFYEGEQLTSSFDTFFQHKKRQTKSSFIIYKFNTYNVCLTM